MEYKKYRARVAFTLITEYDFTEKEALQKVERYKTECQKLMNEGYLPEKTAEIIKDKKGMSKEQFEEAIKGIIQHNKDTIPKVTRPRCNDCKNLCLKNRMITCKMYLNGIPDEILDNKVDCKEFEKK